MSQNLTPPLTPISITEEDNTPPPTPLRENVPTPVPRPAIHIGEHLKVKELDARYLNEEKDQLIRQVNQQVQAAHLNKRCAVEGYGFHQYFTGFFDPVMTAEGPRFSRMKFGYADNAKQIKRVDGRTVTYYDSYTKSMKACTHNNFYSGRVCYADHGLLGTYHEFPIELLYGPKSERGPGGISTTIVTTDGRTVRMKDHLIPIEDFGLKHMYPFTHIIDCKEYPLISPISTFLKEYEEKEYQLRLNSTQELLLRLLPNMSVPEHLQRLIWRANTSFEAFKQLEDYLYTQKVEELQVFHSKLNLSDKKLKEILIENGMLHNTKEEILEKIIEIQRPSGPIETKKREEKKEQSKRRLEIRDKYSLLVASKYLNTTRDDVNLAMTTKVLKDLNSMKNTNDHYITPDDLSIYDKIQTLTIYEGMNEFDFIEREHRFTRIEYRIPIRYSFAQFLKSLHDGHERIFHDIIYSTADHYGQRKTHTFINAMRFKRGTPIHRIFKRTSLKDVPNGVTSIEAECFDGINFRKAGVDIPTLPDSLKEIGWGCFSNCTFGNKIFYLPPNVTKLHGHTFDGAEGLSTIVFNKKVEEIPPYFATFSPFEYVVIPKNIKKIERYAFSEGRALMEVEFEGDSIETIEIGAFEHLGHGIEKVNLPRTIGYIDQKSFAHNVHLKSLGKFDEAPEASDVLEKSTWRHYF